LNYDVLNSKAGPSWQRNAKKPTHKYTLLQIWQHRSCCWIVFT